MKANAPEKIYINTNSQDGTYYISNQYKRLIEYIRKDAFIEKACEYLMEYEFNDSPTIADRRKRVEKFRNYMKGE